MQTPQPLEIVKRCHLQDKAVYLIQLLALLQQDRKVVTMLKNLVTLPPDLNQVERVELVGKNI